MSEMELSEAPAHKRVAKMVPRLIVAAGLALSVTIACIGVLALLQMRHDAIDNARQGSENVALTLERSIARNLQSYELSMHAVADGMKDPEVMSLPPAIRQLVLFDRSINAEDLGSMLATDALGNLMLDSRSTPPRPVNVGDRDYFLVHQQKTNQGIYISRPFQPRLTSDAPSIGISSRINQADGSFGGIVVGTLRLNFFRRLFEGVELGDDGILTLVRADGIVLMRRPFSDGVIGRDISSSPTFASYKDLEQGTRIAKGVIDPVERLYSFRKVGDYPLIVVVGRAVDTVLSAWRKRATAFAMLIAVIDIVIISLALLLARQWKQRVAFENYLRKMVGTDALTGLASRRALDDRADMEWRRALRIGTPLSILMIDVDEFKAYNDHYGHMAGDDALASVARCIATAIRRPGDIAARYEGEEFAVVLPDTDNSGATDVALAIRVAIRHLNIPHIASRRLDLSVSIGVATLTTARDFADLRGLFQAADAALYDAKALGRDRVAAWTMQASQASAPSR